MDIRPSPSLRSLFGSVRIQVTLLNCDERSLTATVDSSRKSIGKILSATRSTRKLLDQRVSIEFQFDQCHSHVARSQFANQWISSSFRRWNCERFDSLLPLAFMQISWQAENDPSSLVNTIDVSSLVYPLELTIPFLSMHTTYLFKVSIRTRGPN